MRVLDATQNFHSHSPFATRRSLCCIIFFIFFIHLTDARRYRAIFLRLHLRVLDATQTHVATTLQTTTAEVIASGGGGGEDGSEGLVNATTSASSSSSSSSSSTSTSTSMAAAAAAAAAASASASVAVSMRTGNIAFRTIAASLSTTIATISMRAKTQRQYRTLLSECEQCYYAQR
jgi:hypothetical protein